MKPLIPAVLALSLMSGVTEAQAKSGLPQETDINQGLLMLAVADKIRRECSNIGGRLFRARSYADGLEDVARSRGYSDAEIDNYINDSVEKAKVRERRNAYFQSKGASNLDAQSLCVLGHQEIAQKSLIGHFLRAK